VWDSKLLLPTARRMVVARLPDEEWRRPPKTQVTVRFIQKAFVTTSKPKMPPKPTQTPDPSLVPSGKKPRRDDRDLNDDADSVDGGMASPRPDIAISAAMLARVATQASVLSDQRVRSLMLGVVPCFNLALQECYSSAVTSLGTSNDHVSLEELRPEELPLLLKHGGHIRLLALRMLESLGQILRSPDIEASKKSAARAALELAIVNGVVPGLFLVAAQVCASIDTKSDTSSPVFVEAEAMIGALQALANLEVFPAHTALKLPDPSHIQWIAAAVSNMWKISVYQGSTAGPSVDPKKASM
jgi:hypothetical protein